MNTQLVRARQFEKPAITEEDLAALVEGILKQHGSVPVGRMGSLLHDTTNNHSLPSMIKGVPRVRACSAATGVPDGARRAERYGGLKRFLERHSHLFVLGADHPFNPHVSLRAAAESADAKQRSAISARSWRLS